MDLNIHLVDVAKTIRFKEYLLNMDIASRRTILAVCIQYMEGTLNDTKKAQNIEWLRNLAVINATDTEERKQRIRFDACWDELHYDLVNSRTFMCMIRSLLI